MRALTVHPGSSIPPGVADVPEPPESDGTLVVETLAVGVCGTDREIVEGGYGTPPPGRDWMVLGHESLGRVIEAPVGSGFDKGDLVVAIVRHPDPVPCPHCASGEWDMCSNGKYTERGIVGRDGFCSEHYRAEPEFAVKIDPRIGDVAVLMEPTTVVAKAWEQVDKVSERALWEPERVLILGAGPIGLLGALIGAQRGLEVHVVDRVNDGLKPALVKELGGVYHSSLDEIKERFDIAIEATGAGALVAAGIGLLAPVGAICLTGLGPIGHQSTLDLNALNRDIVLNNKVVVGSVNANRRHFHLAHQALLKADKAWLGKLITDRAPLDQWDKVFEANPDRIKAVIEVAG